MLRRLYDWTMSLATTRYARGGLAGVSFAESSFFPIPPDVLLIPMVLANRQAWWRLALLCTVASVLGALLGYAIGMFLFEAIGRPILELYGKEDSFEKISAWYNTYGGWGVLFAAITPFPYKVLTIFSGVTGLNFGVFVLVSVVGRSFRFFLVAFLLYRFGEPIRLFIEKYLGLLFVIFMVLLIGGIYAIRYLFQKPEGYNAMSRLTAAIDRSKALPLFLIALAMALLVGTALGFEHIGGYIPCALCLEQRIPYYVGVPVMLLAALSAYFGAPALLTRTLALAGGLLMVYGAGLGIYHSGVEWAWWQGPADCGGAVGGAIDAGNLLSDLNAKKPPSCNEAALRVLGLSFAGWNVIASVILAVPSLRIAYSR